VAAQVARLVAFVASWIVLAGAIEDGDLSAAGLTPWAALVVLSAALAALGAWLEGRFATECSEALRRRLLRGAFGVDPEHVRREGAGRLLGRIMEIEPVAALAATGGLQAVVALVEVVGAVFVLLVHPVGRPLAALLLLLVLATGLLVRAHTHRLVRETDLRLLHTGRLLEELAGARTRRVQDPVTDDPRLRAYQSALAASDRTTALLSVGPARAWQVLALAGLALTVVAADPAALDLGHGDRGHPAGIGRAAPGRPRRLGLTTAVVALRSCARGCAPPRPAPPTGSPPAGAQRWRPERLGPARAGGHPHRRDDVARARRPRAA
jgi:hypothetical protein